MSGLTGYPVVVAMPVQWGDMDSYLHVNNVVYLRWFETGRAAYFTATGVWLAGTSGIAPILHSVSCRFRAPVTYPDDVDIGVRTKSIAEDRFVVEHAVFSRRLGVIAAEGEGVIVSFDYPKGVKAKLPADWREAIERIEKLRRA